jgi:dTDP-4-dehydrorhamnose reductase
LKVLVTGAAGQLGRALVRTLPAGIQLDACVHGQLSLDDAVALRGRVAAARPDLVVNCAAYTAVDRAEAEPERAMATNADGVRNLAEAARAAGARLVHVSTDYVFAGDRPHPYAEDDLTAPASVYGRSKLAGERFAADVLGDAAVVIRTQWLYETEGANFVSTMLRILRERGLARVVADQVGTPTWARGLAEAIWRVAATPGLSGVLHWADAGVASWYDFAVAIREEAAARGLLRPDTRVEPITTAEFPTAARRPAYSVLDTRRIRAATGIVPEHWRVNLRSMLSEVARG